MPSPLVLSAPEATIRKVVEVYNGSGSEVTLNRGALLARLANGKYQAVATTAVTAEVLFAGAGAAVAIGKTLANLPIPETVVVSATVGAAAKTGSADVNGKITGDITGTVDPETGRVQLDSFTPDNATNVTVAYTGITKPELVLGEELTIANAESEFGQAYEAGQLAEDEIYLGSTAWADLAAAVTLHVRRTLRGLGILLGAVTE
jgi:hypothetical protein